MPPEVTPSAPAQPAVAAEPAVAPDPLASLDPADRPIAEKLRDLLAGKSRPDLRQQEGAHRGRGVLSASQLRADLVRQGRRDRAHQGGRSPACKAADADGLDPADYKMPNLAGLPVPMRRPKPNSSSPQTVLTYARHAQAGRFPYHARQRQHRAAAGSRRSRRRADQDRRRRATPAAALDELQPAASGLQDAQGEARRDARQQDAAAAARADRATVRCSSSRNKSA